MHLVTRVDGRTFHVGGRKKPAKPHPIKLHAPRYGLNLAAWPATPSETTFGQAKEAQACLSDILGNDKYGNCTEADQYHRQALRQAAAGRPVFHPTVEEVLSTYSRDGGYVPGDESTDQGCDETTVMQNAAAQGIASGADGSVDKIAGFVAVDASNRDLVRAACSAFVGGSICAALDTRWIEPFPSMPFWTWTVPVGGYKCNPNNGHCFTFGDQTEKMLECWSWGMPFYMTYDALAAACDASNDGALYFVLDAEILSLAASQAPDALDWAALIADFNDMAGAPVVPPAPSPSPSPTPSGPPTLADAIAWASAGIDAADALETRAQAKAALSAGLTSRWPK